MNYTFAQYRESADALQAKLGGFRPKVAMILGSGLGYLGDLVEDAVVVPYGEIPHFKHSTAPGHKGQLVFGRLAGQPVAVMQGRVHHYEGYSYEEVSYGVRVLRLLGCDTLFVTNAAGGVNWKFQAGDLMLITDHIKIFMESPLWGENIPEFGPRFPDASYLYTPRLQELARQQARRLDMDLKEGVYMYFPGPQYETRRALRHGGAGLHPGLQHGRRGAAQKAQRGRGAGGRRRGPGPVLLPGAGLPGAPELREGGPLWNEAYCITAAPC